MMRVYCCDHGTVSILGPSLRGDGREETQPPRTTRGLWERICRGLIGQTLAIGLCREKGRYVASGALRPRLDNQLVDMNGES
jgi:hypothetical protein